MDPEPSDADRFPNGAVRYIFWFLCAQGCSWRGLSDEVTGDPAWYSLVCAYDGTPLRNVH